MSFEEIDRLIELMKDQQKREQEKIDKAKK